MGGVSQPPGLGSAQTWKTTSKVLNTTYTNLTGRPIFVSVSLTAGGFAATFLVDGITVAYTASTGVDTTLTAIVPPGSTYRLNHASVGSLAYWSELS